MRSLIGFVLLVAGLVAALVFVVVPVVIRPLVVDEVRKALPFADQTAVTIEVDVNGISFVLGSIDRIHVAGQELETRSGVHVGALDVTLLHVPISDAAFARVQGEATSIVVPWTENDTVQVELVRLSGSHHEVHATVRLGVRGSLQLIGAAFADAGLAVESLELVNGGFRLGVLGQQGELQLGVDQGALVVPDVFGTGPFAILEPGPDDGWQVTGVAVTTDGIEIDAVLDGGVVFPRR